MPKALPNAQRGRPIRAEHITALADRIRAVEATAYDPHDFEVGSVGGVKTIRIQPRRAGFIAELTSTTSPFSWKEKQWDDAGSAWQDLSGGRTGTTNARHIGALAGLPSGTIVEMWRSSDDTGEVLYLFDVPVEKAGTRDTTLDITPEGTVTADTDTWDVAAQDAGKAGVTLTLTTRVFYDHTAGTPTLYGFEREMVFDVGGRLVTVSAETQYTIDIPEDC